MPSAPTPLLSICVPTFNRAMLLEVCLASLLSQTQPWGELVEVIVSDNASDDGTADVLDRYSEKYSFRRHRHAANIGLLGNITFVPSQLARGDFIWLLGDDDLLAAGAIDQVMSILKRYPNIDLVALNVGYYPYEQRPTAAQAEGGICAVPVSQLRHQGHHGVLPFEKVLEGPCADLTAMYASISRRSWWTTGFPEPLSGESFTSVRTSYPHAWLIAQHMPGREAAAIGDPLVCIYAMPAQQFSWASYHPLTVVLRATELLKLFESHGIPGRVLEPYYLYQLNHRGVDLGNLCWNKKAAGGWLEACRFAWLLKRYPLRVLKIFIVACGNPHAPTLLRRPVQWFLGRKQTQE